MFIIYTIPPRNHHLYIFCIKLPCVYQWFIKLSVIEAAASGLTPPETLKPEAAADTSDDELPEPWWRGEVNIDNTPG